MRLKLAFIIFFLLFVPFALAENSIVIEEMPKKVCPCISNTFVFSILNKESKPQVYNISANISYVEIMPKKLIIKPFSSKRFYLFLTPPCNISKGKYSFNLIISSKNKSIVKKIEYSLDECYSLGIKVEDKEICANQPFNLTGLVYNKGVSSKEIVVKVSEGKLNKTSKLVNAKDFFSFMIKHSGYSKIGEHKLKVVAYYKDMPYINVTTYSNVKIDPCANYEVNISKRREFCLGDTVFLNLIIENKGSTNNSFYIESNANVSTNNITVKPREKRVLKLYYRPLRTGEENIYVKIKPRYGKEKILTSTLDVKDCCNIALISSPTPIEVCLNDLSETSLLLGLYNKGKNDSFEITSDSWWARPELNKLSVSKDKERLFRVRISPISKVGTYRAIIKAKSNNCEDNAYITLKVKKCYDLEVDINDNTSVCACQNISIPIKITNKGAVKDEFEISIDNPKYELDANSIELMPYQSGIVYLKGKSCKVGNEKVLIKISSRTLPEVYIMKELNIKIEDCYNFDVSVSDVLACPNQNISINLLIKNTGTKNDTYVINYNCPKWIKVNQTRLTLMPGDGKNLILSGKVPLLENKSNVCAIIVTSNHSKVKKVVISKINVKDKETCFCTQAQSNYQRISIEKGKTKIVEVKVHNCGLFKQKYKFNVSDNILNWVVIEPKEIELDKDEEDTFYIAITPPLDASLGTYNSYIYITSEQLKKEIPIVVEVK